MLLLIIILSIVASLAVITGLLVLFVRKVLGNRNALLSRAILGLLLLQFLLGMLSNLFARIPQVEPWMVFHTFGPIIFHTANALCLVIFAAIYLINARKLNKFVVPAKIGTAGIGVAFVCGVVFVNAGANDFYSLGMAIGFITAFMAYCYTTFKTNR